METSLTDTAIEFTTPQVEKIPFERVDQKKVEIRAQIDYFTNLAAEWQAKLDAITEVEKTTDYKDKVGKLGGLNG